MSEQEACGYPEPPAVGAEAVTLLGSLERQRSTFAWKCADLDADGLSRQSALARSLMHRRAYALLCESWVAAAQRPSLVRSGHFQSSPHAAVPGEVGVP
jgi:hypothetical protein